MQLVADDLGTPRYEAANVLTDDRYFDNLSGQQAYKCFAGVLVQGLTRGVNRALQVVSQ
jgi:hypothetical protein